MLGSLISAGLNLFNSNKQEKLQKQFAQNAISWKAADAERAGISKVFAMGAPTHSYNPVSVGGMDQLGGAIDTAIRGQSSGGGTVTDKAGGITHQIQQAQLDGLRIDNDIKRSELSSKIAIATQAGAGGTLDTSVITGPDGLKVKKEIAPASGDPNNPQRSFGVSPEVDLYKTKYGYSPQVPQQLQEALESDALGRWQWQIRNRIMPWMSNDSYGSGPTARPGYHVIYDPLLGEYIEIPAGGSKHGPTHRHRWEYITDQLKRR